MGYFKDQAIKAKEARFFKGTFLLVPTAEGEDWSGFFVLRPDLADGDGLEEIDETAS